MFDAVAAPLAIKFSPDRSIERIIYRLKQRKTQRMLFVFVLLYL